MRIILKGEHAMLVLCFMFLQNPFSAIGAHFFILPIFHFLFLSSLKFEMEEEKRGKMEEITSNFKTMKTINTPGSAGGISPIGRSPQNTSHA